ncbi:MAG: hypothetical protein DRN15_10900 [Thermoprotei archaeon]|nr:MAG: hypothetical protein DRN15_10900 [Thermoprotei archaeon]RLF25005.1 MAG: hypothetical protein DRM97_02735 [Thermoprotei archaeon]
MVLNLKPYAESFLEILRSVRRVNVIVLCEGARDAETLKIVARRLGLEDHDVAITDCEGINTLRRDLLPTVLALIIGKVVHKAKIVATLIDSNELSIEDRFRGFIDGVKSRGYEPKDIKKVCHSTWISSLSIPSLGRKISFIISISGLPEKFPNFKSHTIEDHILYLKMLEGRVNDSLLITAQNAKELIKPSDIDLLHEAETDSLEKAFNHIACLLRLIKTAA